MTTAHRISAAAFVAAFGFAASDATAMSPLPDKPAVIGVLWPVVGEVELKSAEIRIECEDSGEVECSWKATYAVSVAGPTNAEFHWSGHRIVAPTVRLDGAQLAPRSAPERGTTRGVPYDRGLPASTRSDFEFEAALTGDHIITLTGTARPPDNSDPLLLDGTEIRHMLLGESAVIGRRKVWVNAGDLQRWSSASPVRVTFATPEEWTATITPEPAEPQLFSTTEGEPVRLDARVPAKSLRMGGPYVALGSSFDGDFTARAGFEFGIDLWTAAGLSVESDFARRHKVAATGLVATPGFNCIFPSVGLAGGPVAVFGDDDSAGVRLELDMAFPFVGGLLSIDWFPLLDDSWQLAAFGRIGF